MKADPLALLRGFAGPKVIRGRHVRALGGRHRVSGAWYVSKENLTV